MALSREVAELVALYKRTARDSRPLREHVRDILWIGNAVDFLSSTDQQAYYREVRHYRDALWRAEQVIEWPNG